jgi:hypothetical protein
LRGDGVLEDPRVPLTQGAFSGSGDVQCDAFFSRAGKLGQAGGEIHCAKDYTVPHYEENLSLSPVTGIETLACFFL